MLAFSLALGFLLVVPLLSIGAQAVAFGSNYEQKLTRGEAITAAVLNVIEAVAVYILWTHTDHSFAIVLAALLWVAQLLWTVLSFCMIGTTIIFTKRTSTKYLVFSVLNLLCVLVLAVL